MNATIKLGAASLALGLSGAAVAQASVTLSGIIDTGLSWTNHVGDGTQTLRAVSDSILGVSNSPQGFASVPFDKAWAAMEKVSKPWPGIDLRDETGLEPVYGISRFIPAVFCECVSQCPLFGAFGTRVQFTRTSGIPASTSRRASSTLCPNRVRP